MGRFSIAGVGAYLPPRVVSTAEIAARVGLDASRIQQLFEIQERRWVHRDESLSCETTESVADLAAHASRAALADAGLRPSDVDLLVVVSTSPEYVSPPLDYRVRCKLDCTNIVGLTLHSACTGIFRAAMLVDALLATGRTSVALITAADTPSRYFVLDPGLPKDLRMSMALYGDGAGAFVAVKAETHLPVADAITVVSSATDECPGIMFSGPQGRSGTGLSGPSSFVDDAEQVVAYHDFRRVLERGGELTRQAADAVLKTVGTSLSSVHHILTHQATGNLKRVAASLGLPADKLHVNIERVGNTLSPSILILFDELKRQGTFVSGDLLLLCSAESATWSYGGMAVHWP